MKFGYIDKKKFYIVFYIFNSIYGIWKIFYEECIFIYILYEF